MQIFIEHCVLSYYLCNETMEVPNNMLVVYVLIQKVQPHVDTQQGLDDTTISTFSTFEKHETKHRKQTEFLG